MNVPRTLPLFALAVTLALPSAAAAAPAAVPAPAIDVEALRIPHHTFTLGNGLRVIVHEDPSVPIVAVNLWYHVGSRNERRGRTGFAHLFEHFFFNGSENYPHGFREAMDDLGANNRNGTTNGDRTNFFEDVPVSALERTLYLEADRMGFLAGHISQEMLERERGVVQNEKRQGENQPYGRVFQRITEAMHPYSHPYSWSTIGSMEDLDAATLEDVKEWYATYYGPNNGVLSLAGDITVERARELVECYFGAIPPGPPLERLADWTPRLDAHLRDTMQDRVPQARIYRVYHAPSWGEPALHHLELLTSVLSGSKSSPLDRRLVYETQLATEVFAGTWERELGSLFLVVATVKAGVEPALVERELDAVVADLLEEGPAADELQRAASRLIAAHTRGAERLGGFGGRSDVLAESLTFGDDSEAYLARLRDLAGATAEQVRDAGREWLGRHHYTLTVEPFPELAAAQETLDRSVLPDLGEPPEVPFPRVQRATLDNGLEVLLLERHNVPLVRVTMAVDAGYAADPAGREGLASLAVDLMDEGTAGRDAFAIADALDALGAELDTASTLDLSLVQLGALAPNLEPSLAVFADVVLHPAFPEEMVALETRRRIARIGQEKAQPLAAAQRLVPPLIYPAGHAYAKPLTGSGYEATVEALGRDDLAAWHRTRFRPGNATLIVTGDVTMERLLPLLREALGGWQDAPVPVKELSPAATAAAGKVYLVDKPGAPQSVLVAAHVSEPGGQPEDLAMEAVMRTFGGMATSRLNRNLRLDKHWSYGAWGLLWDARGQRPLLVVAPVQTDKTVEALREVVAEIRGIAGERPVVGEELASIQRNMVSRLPGRFETLAALESAALDIVGLGYPEEYYTEYAANVRRLGEADLAAAARRFIRPDELAWVILGDREQIEQGVRELGLGEVVLLDADGAVMEQRAPGPP
ncbi:MAG TPA: pitrilysin family protein [Thermoanaerobaculia bacterium]|nr:pitrilysin family protein [Thermoanaerobaculia bacterium]